MESDTSRFKRLNPSLALGYRKKRLETNVRKGFGRQKYEDGSVYEGNWLNSLHNGKGRLTLPNSDFYSGEFVEGEAHGFGMFCHSSGSVYEGFWKDNSRHGFGKEIWA